MSAICFEDKRIREEVRHPLWGPRSPPDVCLREPDRRRSRFEAKCLSNDARVAIEAALPEAIADHGHQARGPATRDVVCGLDRAADERRKAEHPKEVAADPQARESLRLTLDPEQRCRPGQDVIEHLTLPDGLERPVGVLLGVLRLRTSRTVDRGESLWVLYRPVLEGGEAEAR